MSCGHQQQCQSGTESNGRQNGDHQQKCCWAVALEIKAFKKRVFRLYILEALFDLLISVSSVVIDIVTFVVYMQKKKWTYATLTALPILLPTVVFTNIYLKDETRGGHQKAAAASASSTNPNEDHGHQVIGKRESGRFLNRLEEKTKVTKLGPINCLLCWGGLLHSIFHKDRHVRERGAKMAKKSIGRGAKYLFGTLVLRFIAWTWYLKALIFGLKAVKEPKKYMKIEEPDVHWSRELLVRLDFFQAALENAPQCVIQLYALLTDSKEDPALGISALTFSFIDFVRVATTVLWNIRRGPVVAPTNCYGTLIWQLMNVSSWICLYVGRCCAMSLIIGTAASSKGATILIPILAAFVHCGLFAFLIARQKAGQASRKLAVTIFISIFFLPDLDSRDVHVMIQFYYGMILVENTFFIIPWGFDLRYTGYCFLTESSAGNQTMLTDNYGTPEELSPFSSLESNDEPGSHCLIDPVVIVVMVPTLTIVGIVFRLAAAQKMSKFKSAQYQNLHNVAGHGGSGGGEAEKSLKMEDRVAKIYGKKWAKMTVIEMWTAFVKMLQKEVTPNPKPKQSIHNDEHGDNELETKELTDDDGVIRKGPMANELQSHFRDVQDGIRRSFAMVWTLPLNNDDHDETAENEKKEQRIQKNNYFQNLDSLPAQFMSPPYLHHNWPSSLRHHPTSAHKKNYFEHQLLDVRFLKIDQKNGEVHVFETMHI